MVQRDSRLIDLRSLPFDLQSSIFNLVPAGTVLERRFRVNSRAARLPEVYNEMARGGRWHTRCSLGPAPALGGASGTIPGHQPGDRHRPDRDVAGGRPALA